MALPQPTKTISNALRSGCVIPAHPLALTSAGKLDERYQRGLTRYYCDAGAGGVAVGVHTTQFAIRDRKHGLLRPVLQLASETVDEYAQFTRKKHPVIKVGGICGTTGQAVAEAAQLRELGYHIGLLSLSAMAGQPVKALIAHCKAVAREMPIMGFYLQPAVGGCLLPVAFWRRFAQIENVVAIKVAPFNRYQTLDVIRGVAESGRARQIALYTGNDDNIVLDLITRHEIVTGKQKSTLRFVGGLLGHWACWTQKAVELLEECHNVVDRENRVPSSLLTRAIQITDSNAAFFDAANGYAGCIAGIHEVLLRQGLLRSRRCLDPKETLSPGQKLEIDRVYTAYPHLHDDDFVSRNRDRWLRP
ncbi:MAG TPA: dihydrodipicolinate synthase family protein [Candidatus Hydrogenedentes bacterium]|nr:dihydrodipicolinate synthase family protein [Candidatus Hydrogenedentota bacterium]HRK33362.1 dihydrodipicolinate synthase family protein [Candidatus Hydrogenedentota bacterium]